MGWFMNRSCRLSSEIRKNGVQKLRYLILLGLTAIACLAHGNIVKSHKVMPVRVILDAQDMAQLEKGIQRFRSTFEVARFKASVQAVFDGNTQGRFEALDDMSTNALFSMTLRNDGTNPESLYLGVGVPTTGLVEAVVVTNDPVDLSLQALNETFVFGHFMPLSERSNDFRQPVIPVNIDPNETVTVLVRIHDTIDLALYPMLMRQADYENRNALVVKFAL